MLIETLVVNPELLNALCSKSRSSKHIVLIITGVSFEHIHKSCTSMTVTKPTKNRGQNFVDTLLLIKNDKFEVWKHFEERADKLGERLWSTGTWLMTILAVTISLPVAAIAVFGMAFCFYSYIALLDLREHIEGNWRRSTYALTGSWKEPSWGGRKRSGWNTILVVGACAFIAFNLLLIFALLRM